MPPNPTHHDFRKGGFISLWLGDALTSEDDLDAYVRGQFHSEFGFAIQPADGPEYEVSELPRDLADLLEGFSHAPRPRRRRGAADGVGAGDGGAGLLQLQVRPRPRPVHGRLPVALRRRLPLPVPP